MGFFSNLFGKKNCCICGAECGVTKRTGIKNKEYVCSDCGTKCSEHIRLSEHDKAGILEHMALMENQEKIYQKYFEDTKKKIYPSSIEEEQIIFMDDIGMFTIRSRSNPKRKIYHDMFRYDTIESYDYYCKRDKDQNGNEVFKEDGIIIKFCQPNNIGGQSAAAGRRPHPYAKREVVITFRKRDKQANYADNALQHLDFIFGVHRDRTSLFGGPSAQKKAEIKAGAEMLGALASVAKAAAKDGLEAAVNNADLQAKVQGAMNAADEANTRGLSQYSQAADAAESSVG